MVSERVSKDARCFFVPRVACPTAILPVPPLLCRQMNGNITIECPLCHDQVEKLLYRYHLGNERLVIDRIRMHNPGWTENDGACSRCVDYYHTEIIREQRILPEVGPFFPVKSADDFIILPTGLRMDADPRFTGKGVTICFIDSGFYLHPDLVQHQSRIKATLSIAGNHHEYPLFSKPDAGAWHGTMTTVVCAGDGWLSKGLYRGIASEASLVLISVQDEAGSITTENIVKALEWVLQNHQQYNIRIVNMSLGVSEAESFKQSETDRLAEALIDQGVIVVAAAGNDENALIKPPANAPHVITVGGTDDQNDLEKETNLYHSAYGSTIDGLMKPEVVAPAIWIAAPVLPGTPEQKEAATLYHLLGMNDETLVLSLRNAIGDTRLPEELVNESNATQIREAIINRIQATKYISPDYMHVDGTSFAAPITCSLIAQMLEIDPTLTPARVRELLFSCAKRLPHLAPERQGFGEIQARRTVLKTLKKEVICKPCPSPFVNRNNRTIEFYMQHDHATQISVAGSFNQWAGDVLLMEPGEKGLWRLQIPLLPTGTYTYKFLVDEKYWMEDVDNPYRQPDGFQGFNSLLFIENQDK